jgi:bilin biosynthesis protein
MSSENVASLDQLFEDLLHPNPNIQQSASFSIADSYSDIAIPRLLLLLESENPAIYRSAVKALGVIGPKTFSPLITLFNNSVNPTVRACCVKALVQIAVNFPDEAFPEDSLSVLSRALNDISPVVSQSSLMTLGYIAKATHGGDRAVPILIEACSSDNIAHVQAAAMALAEVDSPKARECLLALASDQSTDPLVLEIVQSCLERMGANLNSSNA